MLSQRAHPTVRKGPKKSKDQMNKESQEERRPPVEIGPNEFGTKGVQDQTNPGTKEVKVALMSWDQMSPRTIGGKLTILSSDQMSPRAK